MRRASPHPAPGSRFNGIAAAGGGVCPSRSGCTPLRPLQISAWLSMPSPLRRALGFLTMIAGVILAGGRATGWAAATRACSCSTAGRSSPMSSSGCARRWSCWRSTPTATRRASRPSACRCCPTASPASPGRSRACSPASTGPRPRRRGDRHRGRRHAVLSARPRHRPARRGGRGGHRPREAATPGEGRAARHPTFGLWPVALRDELRAALAAGLRKVTAWPSRGAAPARSSPTRTPSSTSTPPTICVRARALAEAARA